MLCGLVPREEEVLVTVMGCFYYYEIGANLRYNSRIGRMSPKMRGK